MAGKGIASKYGVKPGLTARLLCATCAAGQGPYRNTMLP